MRNDNWASSDNKVYVTSKLPPCPATDFVNPDIKRVLAEMKADDDEFVPEYGEGENEARLLANLPSGEISLASGSCETVDCGFSLKMPPGYKCMVSSTIPNLFVSLADSDRCKLNVFNAGKKTVLRHKQIVGKIWVETVYLFEWKAKGLK